MRHRTGTALVTGGTGGIGRAFVDALVERGWEVLACGRSRARLEELQSRVPSVNVHQVDLANQAQIERLVDRVRGEHDHLDLLINNAAMRSTIRVTEPERFDPGSASREIATNLTAPICLTLACIPLLLDSDKAAIVNVTSILGVAPVPSAPIYSATKAGLINFTRSLRSQLEGSGVQVVDLMPPLVDTEMAANVGSAVKMSPGDFAEKALDLISDGQSRIRIGRNPLSSRAIDVVPDLLSRSLK